MSRSFKKNPIVKDNGGSKKISKNIANRRIRARQKQGIEVGSGSSYKKHYEQWDIADDVSRWSKEEAIEYYNNPNIPGNHNLKEEYPTLEDFLKF